jgi:hypothetical protein
VLNYDSTIVYSSIENFPKVHYPKMCPVNRDPKISNSFSPVVFLQKHRLAFVHLAALPPRDLRNTSPPSISPAPPLTPTDGSSTLAAGDLRGRFIWELIVHRRKLLPVILFFGKIS